MHTKTMLELIAIQRNGTRDERRASIAEQARRFVERQSAAERSRRLA